MSTESASVPEKCYSCSAELVSPAVCGGCRTLYPLPKSVDHFALLGLPRAYDLDERTLEERYLAVSRHVHPDYFSAASDEMRQLSTRLAAELNEAVNVLRDPIARAAYLLELCGGPSAAGDRSVPGEVLGETMMLREEIEEARADGDDSALERLRGQVEARRGEWLARVRTGAAKLPGASDTEKRDLRQSINAIKYYENMRELLWRD
jgi:molecular chaperone HscB